MHISNTQALSTSLANAWQALNDTEILKACIPGCETLTETSTHQYDLVILAAIGPVKARFKGKLMLSDLHPPKAYKIKFEGQGGAAGYGKGEASVTLEEIDGNTTQLNYAATASVGGKIAQIGQRLVDMAAQKMATEFFAKFNTELERAFPPEATTAQVAYDCSADDKPQPISTWQKVVRLIGR